MGAAFLLPLAGGAQAQELPREARLNALEAVVQVTAYDVDRGVWTTLTGSGTIISPDGYILTNFHVLGSTDDRSNYPRAGIFQTDIAEPWREPQHRFWADYVAGDPRTDLALLRIVSDADGNPLTAADLAHIPLADSDRLLPGDLLTVVGYPGISGSTITFTQGIMSGWLGEDTESGGQAWIKTDAKITRGNSGGAALNSAGQLVAVPTSGSHLMDEGDVYEEQLYARPVNLAWPLFTAVADSIVWVAGDRPDAEQLAAAGPAWTLPAEPHLPAGFYGPLVPGQAVSASIAGDLSAVVWHTYTVDVTTVPATLRVSADSGDDIDLAVGLRGEIPSYDGGYADFMDFTLNNSPEIAIDIFEPTLVHIDVVNAWGYPISYTAEVTVEPLDRDAAGYPAPRPNGHRGRLQAGTEVRDNLAPRFGLGLSSWHTYVLDVPQGTSVLTVQLDPESVLGLAIKPGTDIFGYDLPEDGGDVWAIETSEGIGQPVVFTVDNPLPGMWFIDVFDLTGRVSDGRYVLQADFKMIGRSRQ